MTLADGQTAELQLVDDARSLRAEWSALAEQSRNVFVTPEWTETWRAHYAPDAERKRNIQTG